jgi:hypothetical protein
VKVSHVWWWWKIRGNSDCMSNFTHCSQELSRQKKKKKKKKKKKQLRDSIKYVLLNLRTPKHGIQIHIS